MGHLAQRTAKSRASKKKKPVTKAPHIQEDSDLVSWHAQLLKRAPLKHTPPPFERWHQFEQHASKELPADLREKMERFAELVMETNARMNLTSAASYQELYSRHIADSLSLLPFFARSSAASSSSFPSSSSSSGSSSHGAGSASSVEEEAARARGGGGGGGGGRVRVLDVGTGGGLPGVVLASAMPATCHVTCVDSVQRKVSFVSVVARVLPLPNLLAIHSRVEALQESRDHRGQYTWVVARAVADLSTLVQWAAPLLADTEEGGLLAMKGDNVRGDLERARLMVCAAGMEVVCTEEGGEVWHAQELGTLVWLRPKRAMPKGGDRAVRASGASREEA